MLGKADIFSEQEKQLRVNYDHYTNPLREKKKLLLSGTDTYEQADAIAELEKTGIFSLEETPVDGMLRLSDNIAAMDDETARRVALSMLEILCRLEKAHVFAGIIDIDKTFYDETTGNVCLRCGYNVEIAGVRQTWELCSEDMKYFGCAAYLPFTVNMQNLANLRLIYKILCARSNSIPEDVSYADMLRAVVADRNLPEDGLLSAEELLAYVGASSRSNASAVKPKERKAHFIYCIVPFKGRSGREDIFYSNCCKALLKAKDYAGEMVANNTVVTESYIAPDIDNDMVLIRNEPYSPLRVIDIPKVGFYSSYNALATAALMIEQLEATEPGVAVYMNVFTCSDGVDTARFSANAEDKRLRVFCVGDRELQIMGSESGIKDNADLLRECVGLFGL